MQKKSCSQLSTNLVNSKTMLDKCPEPAEREEADNGYYTLAAKAKISAAYFPPLR
jgi:hypothetical protein